jgi:hypothetical protein
MYHILKVVAEVFMVIEDQPGRLCVRDYYRRLEQSERAAGCGVIGVAMAKCVAEKVLAVPVLHLVDPLIAAGVLERPSGRTRGDLVGWDKDGDWHVIEAKGRATRRSADAIIEAAKAQAANVVLLASNGRRLPAATNAACVTALTDPLHVLLDDPPPEEEQPLVLTIDPDAFARAYYRPARALVEAEASLALVEYAPLADDARFVVAQLPTTDLWFGIHEHLWTLVREDGAEWFDGVVEFTEWWSLVLATEESSRRDVTDAGREGPTNLPAPISIGLDGYILFNEPDLFPRSTAGVRGLGLISP